MINENTRESRKAEWLKVTLLHDKLGRCIPPDSVRHPHDAADIKVPFIEAVELLAYLARRKYELS